MKYKAMGQIVLLLLSLCTPVLPFIAHAPLTTFDRQAKTRISRLPAAVTVTDHLPRINISHAHLPTHSRPWRLPPAYRVMLARLLVHSTRSKDGAAALRVWDAFKFSMRFHRGQYRKSGEPYITHPLEVASMLASQQMDITSVMTGLLHDTVEDTGVTLEQLRERFGDEVATLVDGVTKLSKLELQQELKAKKKRHNLGDVFPPEQAHVDEPSPAEKQAANLRKLVLAMSDDIRVLLIKLTDRLHNMRTLSFVTSPSSRRFKAEETLQIYAPLALRIGMYDLAKELETLSFEELHPADFKKISEEQAAYQKSGQLFTIISEIRQALEPHGTLVDLHVQNASTFRLWLRMKQSKTNHQMSDPASSGSMAQRNESRLPLGDCVRLILVVSSPLACYEALGVVHQQWRSLGVFKDYISTPKPNRYQSLHTTVLGPNMQLVDLMIRTQPMHEVASRGILAEWQQQIEAGAKEPSLSGAKYSWLRSLQTISDASAEADDFIEAAQMELLPDQVFCFTPNGDILSLPRGSTPLDFAYAIHSSIGNHCYLARVNGRPQSIHSTLRNGDLVELIQRKTQEPAADWENLVVSGRARAEIRRYNNAKRRGQLEHAGRVLLHRAATADAPLTQQSPERQSEGNPAVRMNAVPFSAKLSLFTDAQVFQAARTLPGMSQLQSVTDIYARLAQGKTLPTELLNALKLLNGQPLLPPPPPPPLPPPTPQPSAAAGSASAEDSRESSEARESLVVQFARCCTPVAGDEVQGVLQESTGRRRLVVHRASCRALASQVKLTGKHVQVRWGSTFGHLHNRYMARLTIKLQRACHSLLNIVAKADELNVTITRYAERAGEWPSAAFDVKVRDRGHLQQLMAEIGTLPFVQNVSRT